MVASGEIPRPVSVLLVDDHDDSLNVIARVLELGL